MGRAHSTNGDKEKCMEDIGESKERKWPLWSQTTGGWIILELNLESIGWYGLQYEITAWAQIQRWTGKTNLTSHPIWSFCHGFHEETYQGKSLRLQAALRHVYVNGTLLPFILYCKGPLFPLLPIPIFTCKRLTLSIRTGYLYSHWCGRILPKLSGSWAQKQFWPGNCFWQSTCTAYNTHM